MKPTSPHVVEFMPIGSHHTWAGLAFVKGMVGFYSLAIPMILIFFFLLIKAQTNPNAGTGLAILFILFLYTFGENLEILAYLYWPCLIMMGIGFQPHCKLKSVALKLIVRVCNDILYNLEIAIYFFEDTHIQIPNYRHRFQNYIDN